MRLIVNTKHGPVEGFAREGIRRWFGIPFAAPPVGALRFRRARDPESWTEVRPCTRMGCAPIQFAAGPMAETMVVSAPVSEDCLYLNVWAPEQAEKVPVFVYIYGGANHMGEASAPDHDLSAFAREGMVGVSFNYRLGPLGFYNFSRLGPDFDSNCAVSDMIQALKWVHENIAAFGGDPENVTICGESAGGTGVYSLLAAPAARGYFQKAIPMSGLAGNVTTQYIHDLNNALFFDELGLDPGSAAKLKTMPVSELIRGAEMEQRLLRLMDYGLQGMEAFYSGFSPEERQEVLDLADQYDLYVTAGSDYHGTNKKVRLGDTGLGDIGFADTRLSCTGLGEVGQVERGEWEYPRGLLRFLERVQVREKLLGSESG